MISNRHATSEQICPARALFWDVVTSHSLSTSQCIRDVFFFIFGHFASRLYPSRLKQAATALHFVFTEYLLCSLYCAQRIYRSAYLTIDGALLQVFVVALPRRPDLGSADQDSVDVQVVGAGRGKTGAHLGLGEDAENLQSNRARFTT